MVFSPRNFSISKNSERSLTTAELWKDEPENKRGRTTDCRTLLGQLLDSVELTTPVTAFSKPIDVLSLFKGRLFRIAAFLCTCLHSHTQPCRRINSQPFFLMTQLFYCTDYPLSFLVVRKIAQESRSLWLECRAMINPRNDPNDTRWRSVCCITSNVKWANGPRWTKWVAKVVSLEDIV